MGGGGILEPMKRLLLCWTMFLGMGLLNATAQDKKEEKKPVTPPVPGESATAPTPTAAKEVAVIKTSLGDMVLEFWPDVAPKHVENFKALAKKGFYDGTAFHRVIKGFMIQGGDPLTKDESARSRWGTGDPGYKINAEFNDRQHVRGVLSMARSQDPNSAGSQFFICLDRAPHLDKAYTAFGKLIKGEDVLMKIGTTATGPRDVPVTRVNVDSVKIAPADAAK
jgi:peptidyl-prolyl cis-trans isomerase B (cyclophilin B)